MSSTAATFDSLRWYAIHTHLHQESRAEGNLKAWNIQTFYPRMKERRRNEFSGATSYITKPFFLRYLFARFDLEQSLHKVSFTRGVHSVVSFGGLPSPVDDDVIDFFQARADSNGFVRIGEDFKPGDRVVMKGGMLNSLVGVFERAMNDSERVMILLQTINYQGRVIVERHAIQKVAH